MRFFALLIPIFLFCEDSFITKYEYGEMLYKNPRGIGCHNCHGLKGEGSVIAKYKHKDKNMVLDAPKINSLTFLKFKSAVTKKHTIMPKYHLADSEIKVLYFYITEKSKEQKMLEDISSSESNSS